MKRYALASLLAATLLAGCDGRDAGNAAPKLEMHVYDVPAAQTESLARTLGNVLAGDGKAATGKVSSPAPGRLVVLAPASLQESIEASLRSLAKEQATDSGASAAGPATPMRLSFWSVDAVPENGPDDSTLAALTPALDEARRQLGIVHFELRDHVSGISSVGQRVERSWIASGAAAGANRQLVYTIDSRPPGLMLELNFGEQTPVGRAANGAANVSYLSTGTQTTTAIAPGQTLVVTQNPVPEGDGSSSVMRLYVVRVDPVATP